MMLFREFLEHKTNEKFVLAEKTQNKIDGNPENRSQQMEQYHQRRKFHKRLVNEVKIS